jgi:hypothetical protein
MFLLAVKGAQSYNSLRTYNNITYATFKEACSAHGLLSNDQEWYNAFDEAASWATSSQLRQLFVTMLVFCEVGDEFRFFDKVWRFLTDDIQYNVHQTLNHQSYQMSDTDLQDEVLERLGTLFNKRGRRIDDFSLPRKFVDSLRDAAALLTESKSLIAQLNSEQRHAFDSIANIVITNSHGFFFVSGYGDTRKTFLWNTIITYL